MDIVFPEDVGLARTAPRALQLKHVLALIYCFGGTVGVIAVLSKFVIMPLFEQLTYERRLIAEETREKVAHLNIVIAKLISKIPGTKTLRSPYVEVVVPAGESQASNLFVRQTEEGAKHYTSQLRELRTLISTIDPNNEVLGKQSQVTAQSEELQRYARDHLRAEVMPRMYSLPGFEDPNSSPLFASIVKFRQEIRAVKSALLS